MPTATATAGSIYWACGLVIFSSFISALPNVAYEKVLTPTLTLTLTLTLAPTLTLTLTLTLTFTLTLSLTLT